MVNGTIDQLMKHSFLYSYILSQPFTVYVDAYPVFENKMLLEETYLSYGQHGQSVRILQKKLNKLKYYDDEIDGEYGVLTEYALKKFQKDHQINITGQANMETIELIVEMDVETELEKLKDLSRSIEPGMQNEDVKIIQEILYYFGYYSGEIDGIFGPLTEEAIKTVEENYDVEILPEVTKDSVENVVTDMKEEHHPPKEESPPQQGEQNSEVKDVQATKSNHPEVIQTAQALLGSPYTWGGTSPDGFDCSGFIQYVYETEDRVIPRTVSDIWNFASPAGDTPSIGDLVFFETYQAGPSHLGIYIGNNEFIHAGETNGVEISNLTEEYWSTRFIGVKRIE